MPRPRHRAPAWARLDLPGPRRPATPTSGELRPSSTLRHDGKRPLTRGQPRRAPAACCGRVGRPRVPRSAVQLEPQLQRPVCGARWNRRRRGPRSRSQTESSGSPRRSRMQPCSPAETLSVPNLGSRSGRNAAGGRDEKGGDRGIDGKLYFHDSPDGRRSRSPCQSIPVTLCPLAFGTFAT